MKKYIFGNWKMNQDWNAAQAFVDSMNNFNNDNIVYGIACNALFINALNKNNHSKLHIIAQDVSMHDRGAYTNQISANDYKAFNIKFSLVGHSETRAAQQLSDLDVNLKVKECIKNEIVPIICIGESITIYNNKETICFLIKQIDVCCNQVDLNKIIIAYEPLWAIGSGKTPTLEEIENILTTLKKHYQNKLIILYGGSVNKNNFNDIINLNNIDGVLIGNASLDATTFKWFLEEIK